MTVKVMIIESDDWAGQKIDEVKEFPTREEADIFIKEFNSENDKDDVPGWYMYAELVKQNA